MAFATRLDLNAPLDAIAETAAFARDLMTATPVSADFRDRIRQLMAGNRRLRVRDIDREAMAFAVNPTYAGIARLLETLRRSRGSRLFRPTLYNATMGALSRMSAGSAGELRDAARAEREQRRRQERNAERLAIGSTLLLKGLEADCCMILDAHTLERNHLYVALTRGTKRIVIWSAADTLDPA